MIPAHHYLPLRLNIFVDAIGNPKVLAWRASKLSISSIATILTLDPNATAGIGVALHVRTKAIA
jgi:hypothetical protein